MKKLIGLAFICLALSACGAPSSGGDSSIASVSSESKDTASLTSSVEEQSSTEISSSIVTSVETTIPSSEQTSIPASTTTSASEEDVYTLNATNVTVEVGETFQFSLLKNGIKVTKDVWWQVSTDLIEITQDGLLRGVYPTNAASNAFVRGSIGNHYVDCPVTVVGRNNAIYRCMTTQYASSAKIEQTNHVIYSSEKKESGSRIDGTKFSNTYLFTYDSLTEECYLKTIHINYYVNGEGYQWEEIYAGFTSFIWGKYEEGYFYGMMGDVVHDTDPGRERQLNVVFVNDQLIFNKETYKIGVHQNAEFYQIEKNTYTNYTVTVDDIIDVLKVVVECKEFADNEVFKNYNNAHSSDAVKLF